MLGAALDLIGGSAVAMRVLAFFARFSNPAVVAAAMGDGRPDNRIEDMKGLQDAYREEREKNKVLGLDRETGPGQLKGIATQFEMMTGLDVRFGSKLDLERDPR